MGILVQRQIFFCTKNVIFNILIIDRTPKIHIFAPVKRTNIRDCEED